MAGDKSPGMAAAQRLLDDDTFNPAFIVIANPIVDADIVTFARHHHVIVAVIPDLCRQPGQPGHKSHSAGRQIALGLLAAKSATHAATVHGYGMKWHTKNMGHRVLDLAGVLGSRMHEDFIIFTGGWLARPALQGRNALVRRHKGDRSVGSPLP